jgi:hypothetical protein
VAYFQYAADWRHRSAGIPTRAAQSSGAAPVSAAVH